MELVIILNMFSFHQENEVTVISITHDIEEVAQSDNVIVLEEGQIALMGSPKQVFKNEKIMVKMQLDIPFAYKLRNELAKRNVKISDSLDLERVADEVCQYVLKK